jgi:two-component system cell cycle sensor histidine kinase PleC
MSLIQDLASPGERSEAVDERVAGGAPLREQIAFERLVRLFGGASLAAAIEPLASLAVLAALWAPGVAGHAGPWIMMLWGSAAARAVAYLRFRQSNPEPSSAGRWLFVVGGLLLVSGLIWGWGLWHLWPEAPEARFILVMAVVAVAVLVSGLVAGKLAVAVSFLGGVVIGAALGLADRAGDHQYILAVAMLLPVTIALVLVASRFGAALDASDRLRLQLIAAKEAAQDASRAKSEFIANMSHELRTPLNAVIGFSEIIKDQVLGPVGNERYAEYATDIHQSGTHLLAIINDILDLARVESGKIDLSDQIVRLPEILSFLAALMSESVERAGVTLSIDVPQELPALRADERALKQMLINLLSNSVKFTPIGGEVRVTAHIAPDGDLIIQVKDTGIGISSEDLPRVMEPFGQVEGALSRRHQGTGLGLSLTRSMARQHGGELVLESRLGQGTIATIRLPGERLLGRSSA